MKSLSDIKEALTFDDVLLKPGYSEIRPAEADLTTKCSRNIALNIPIMSAAMDTVTESGLAIALARQGGLGVIHRNLTIAAQAAEVDKVKRSESGMIVNPITMSPEQHIGEAVTLMERYHISGVPIVQADGKLVGILTNRDLRFETRLDLPIAEAMTKDNLVTAPVGTTLEQAKVILQKRRVEKLLIVDAQTFQLKGLITVKDIDKAINYPKASKDPLGRLRVAAAVGVTGDFFERTQALVAVNVDAIVVDTAHGHTKRVIDAVKKIKSQISKVDVIAGNIATSEGARALIEAGVDGVKVGMGPGSICTTRVISGCGMPQISAVMDAALVAERAGVPVIADGGIKYSGDITKAIAAGADCVMLGSLFAGTDESPGEVILYQGRTFKSYRGMGSLGAMQSGSRDRYGQESASSFRDLVPEGIEGRISHKGSLQSVVTQLVGGVRAGMGYCGTPTIAELKAKTEFVRITPAGHKEGHVHDVIITKEAPNYNAE